MISCALFLFNFHIKYIWLVNRKTIFYFKIQDSEPPLDTQAFIISFSNWKTTPKLPQTSGCISQQRHHRSTSFTAVKGMCILTELLTFLKEVSSLLFLLHLTTVWCFPHFSLFLILVFLNCHCIVSGIPLSFSLTYTVHIYFADNKKWLTGYCTQLQQIIL